MKNSSPLQKSLSLYIYIERERESHKVNSRVFVSSNLQTSLEIQKNKIIIREKIHDIPKNSYKLLPWLCERLVDINPRMIDKEVTSFAPSFKMLYINECRIEG